MNAEQTTDTNDQPQQLSGRVLCVDDERQILTSLKRIFRRSGHSVEIANSAAEGLEYLAENEVDIVISDMRMPEMDGHHFLAEVAKQWPDTIRMLLTGYSDMESTIGAINNGSIYRYICKPWDDNDLLITTQQALETKRLREETVRLGELTNQQNQQLQLLNSSLEIKVQERTSELQASKQEIEQAYSDSIAVFATIISMRNGDGIKLNQRTAEAADLVAKKLKLSDSQRKDLRYAALLHDIGTIGLPDDLIKTPYEKMDTEQKTQFQQHATNGEALLVSLIPLYGASSIIRSHHEQVSGTGYPDNLKGDEIPIEARILSVVTEYEDLRSGALLGTPMDSASASSYLTSNSVRRYDPLVVDAFIAINESLKKTEAIERELILSIDNVEPGMVLAEDVYLRENVLMLRSGQALTPMFIQKYKSLKADQGDAVLLKIRTGTQQPQDKAA